jgi:chromosome segregation ATPase
MAASETPKDSPVAGTAPCSEPTAEQLANPEEGLKALKALLECRQNEVDTQTKKRDALKEDIGALESAVTSLKQILSDYSQALPALQADVQALRDYLANKQRMIEAALGDQKAVIDKTIQDVDSGLAAKQDDLNKKSAAKVEAANQQQAAQDALDQKQATFDAYKQFKSNLQKQDQEMQQLRGTIEKEDEKNNTANMYFWALELKTILDKVNPVSADELKNTLYQAWKQLHDAKKDLSDKKLAWQAKKADFEAASKALGTPEEQKQNRRDEVLNKIVDLNKPAKSAAAA